MPLIAWSAQSNGYFADDFDLAAVPAMVSETYESAVNRARRERARELARRRGLSAPQIALAWVLDQPFAPYALVGARTPAALREAWAAASDMALTAEELSWLETGRP
jgi:aryl-alcohol dehydrogenase-like predicted oxidoreductase